MTRWYSERGYNFLVLSDHNVHTSIERAEREYAVPGRFMLMRGEEVTSSFEGKAIHVNGLDTRTSIGRQAGTSILDILQKSVDAIRKQSGVPHINHPNFTWALTAEQLQQVKNNKLFEVYSGHPMVNSLGGGGVPGLEAAWDAILSNGVSSTASPWTTRTTSSSRGSRSCVARPRLDHGPRDAPRAARDPRRDGARRLLRVHGRRAERRAVDASSMTVAVRQTKFAKYRIQFIGSHGALLQESLESPATYTFKGTEGYVRAEVLESNGQVAWVQPVVLR